MARFSLLNQKGSSSTKNAFGWNRLFPSERTIWAAFAKLAVFGALQFIFFWGNTLADTLMISSNYFAGQTVEGIVLTEDTAKKLNTLANSGLGGVGQWWYIISALVIFTSVMVGFFVSQYYATGQVHKVSYAASLKLQLCVLVVVPFLIVMLLVPEQMVAFITRKEAYNGVLVSVQITGSSSLAVVNDTYSNVLGANYARLAGVAYLIWAGAFAVGSSQRDLGDPRGMTYGLGVGLLLHIAVAAGAIYGAKAGIQGLGYALIASRALNLFFVSLYGTLKKYPATPYGWHFFKWDLALCKQVAKRWPYPLLGLMWSTGVVGRFFFWYDYFPGDQARQIASALDVTSAAGQIQNPFLIQADFVLPIISVYVAQNLGKGNAEEARKYGRYVIGFAFTVGIIVTLLLGSVAFAIPSMQGALNYEPYVLDQARWAVLIVAFTYPTWAVLFTISPTVASGGRTVLITCVDGGTTWLQVGWVVALGEIQKATGAFDSFALAYICFFITDFLKLIPFGLVYKKSKWYQNITKDPASRRALTAGRD